MPSFSFVASIMPSAFSANETRQKLHSFTQAINQMRPTHDACASTLVCGLEWFRAGAAEHALIGDTLVPTVPSTFLAYSRAERLRCT